MTHPPKSDGQIIPDPGRERNLFGDWIETGWLLIALLVPLGVSLWARQPFEPTKAAILRSLVWFMAGLWLVEGVLARRPPWRDLRGNPLVGPVLALLAVQTAATLLAVDRGLSLWGSYERAQGFLTLLSYALLFLLVAAHLRTAEQARRLVGVLVVTALPLVGLGLAQALGWRWGGLITDARSPVFATLGRSNFLGAYLALLLPLTLAGLLVAPGRRLRLAAGGLAVAEGVVIALTLARGAWLAAGTAVGAFGLLWFWPRLSRRGRWLAVGGGLLALGGGLAAMRWLGGAGGSTAARLTIWRATLDLIARRPLLGYGPEALGLVFPRVYPPQLVYYQGRGVVVDRAHNLLLDRALTGGLAGLLAEAALLAAFFAVGWRALRGARDRERRALLAACLAAVAANAVGNLVSFDTTATATATWLLLALLSALTAQTFGLARSPQALRSTRWSWAIAGLVLLVLAGAVYGGNLRPLAADMAAHAADLRSEQGDWAGALRDRERAVALWPLEPEHHLALSWSYLQQAQTGSSPIPWLERAERELLAARALRPADFHIWAALGELYGLWGLGWDAARLPLAHDAYRRATALAPHQATLYTAWGLIALHSGDAAQAVDLLQRAVDLDATDGYAFSHLGDAELALGRVDRALAAYRQAVHWEPDLVYAHLGLARCYRQLGRRAEAVQALEQALRLDPNHAAALELRRQMAAEP